MLTKRWADFKSWLHWRDISVQDMICAGGALLVIILVTSLLMIGMCLSV